MAECHLYKLPNELLLYLLTPIPTPDLLRLTPISHRIYSLILRILHNRLIAASELHSHTLLLESFHPSAKLTEPHYFCTYRGTDGLTLYDNPEEDTKLAWRLGEMRKMYSRFRPHRRELEPGGRRVVRPPGDVPGSRTFPGTAQDKFEGDTVKQVLSLEGHELFTQLVTQTNLVKISPRTGLFTSFVGVEEGVIRVWREWLRGMAAKAQSKSGEQDLVVEEVGVGKATVKEVSEEKRDLDEERIMWVTESKHSGVRFNIRERKLRRDAPILVSADEEDMPVSYEMEYEELLIRTSHLLVMLERSLVQEDNTSGKAVVFGSFG